jgi:hypothetical protein
MCVIYANPGMTEEQRELQQELKTLQTTPYSTSFNTLSHALKAGSRVKELKLSRKDISISENPTGDLTIKVSYKDTEEILTIDSDQEQPGEALAVLANMQKSSSRKLLTYILQKINNELLDNGAFIEGSNTIEIFYDRLADLGIFKTAKTAKKGLLNFYDFLRRCTIIGYATDKDGKRQQIFKGSIVYNLDTPLYSRAAILSVNDKLQWEQLGLKYYYIPAYYYQLPENAADLLNYICSLAPLRWEELQSTGQFSLSYEAIRAYLQLPEPGKATNPTAQVRTPIEKAIGELADQTGRDKELQIIPDNKPARRIQDYLKRQLIIKVGGEYLTTIAEYPKAKKAKRDRFNKKIEDKKARIIAERELKNAENKANT